MASSSKLVQMKNIPVEANSSAYKNFVTFIDDMKLNSTGTK